MLRTKRSHSPAPSIASTSSSRSADSPPPRKRVFRSSDTDTDLPPAAPNAFLAPHSSTSSSHKRSAVDLDLSDASDSSEDVLEGAPARVSRPPPKRIRRNLSDSFDRLGFRDQDGEIMGDPCDLEQGMAPSAVELPASEIEEGDLRGVWVGHAPPDEALGRDGMRFELLDEDDEAGAGGPGRGALQLERWQGARPLPPPPSEDSFWMPSYLSGRRPDTSFDSVLSPAARWKEQQKGIVLYRKPPAFGNLPVEPNSPSRPMEGSYPMAGTMDEMLDGQPRFQELNEPADEEMGEMDVD